MPEIVVKDRLYAQRFFSQANLAIGLKSCKQ